MTSQSVASPPRRDFVAPRDATQILIGARRESRGRPLEQEVCRFMEDRFHHGFGAVRIHTDHAACLMTRALQAEACALGNDIFFAEGRYDPRTDRGKRVLAHELAHVVQWARGGGPQLSLDCVDDPASPFEREAERASQLILTDRPMPPVTPDPTGRLRCAVTVASSSLSPIVGGGNDVYFVAPQRDADGSIGLYDDEGDARPTAFLTAGRMTSPSSSERAFGAAANVVLARSGPGESAAGWQIGFLQFLRFKARDATYRGRTTAGGSIFAQWYPSGIQAQLALDLVRGERGPWYVTQTRAFRRVAAGDPFPDQRTPIVLTWDDTPGTSIPLILNHRIGSQTHLNYLYSVWHVLQFVTVLAAWPPAAPGPIALKYFDWETVWRLTVTAPADINAPWIPTFQTRMKRILRSGDGIPADSAYAGVRARFSGSWDPPLPLVREIEAQCRVPTKWYFPDWR